MLKIIFGVILAAGLILMVISVINIGSLGGLLQWGLVILGIVGLVMVSRRKK